MFDLTELQQAQRLVHGVMAPTPLYRWPLLAERSGAEVWVKHENHSPLGAFKVRGGLVYVERLRQRRPEVAGLVSATRGNHGQSLAFAGARAGVPVTIVVPHGNAPEKNAAMRALGARLIEAGHDFEAARQAAGRLAAAEGLEPVAAFHPDLVCGVATYALELFQVLRDLDTVYVPIGMGSGICGLIRTRDLLGLSTRIVGVVAAGAPAMALSVAAGRVVTTERADTVADGLACRVPEPQVVEIVRAGAERVVQVSEDGLIAAMRAYWSDTHNLAEGAGAAPLAALLQEREQMRGRRVGLILSGGNLDLGQGLPLLAAA